MRAYPFNAAYIKRSYFNGYLDDWSDELGQYRARGIQIQVQCTASQTWCFANFGTTANSGNAAFTGDVVFTVECSDTLAPNSWSNALVTQSIFTDNGQTQTVRATVPTGPAIATRYPRLKVTQAP